jgi:translation initiation factor 4E
MTDISGDPGQLTADDKHPLEHAWVIWYDSRRLHTAKAENTWLENLQTVAIFNTVEDFWSTYNHIKRPADLEFGANYHMFKEGVKPMWEDEANKKGGKWVMTLNAKEDSSRLDELWELLLLSIIGEYLDDGPAGDQICGAVLSRRKAAPRISVWTRDRDDKASLQNVGSRLRSILKLSEKTPLEYQSHADSISTGTSYLNQAKLTC